jgi:hypothetical protein
VADVTPQAGRTKTIVASRVLAADPGEPLEAHPHDLAVGYGGGVDRADVVAGEQVDDHAADQVGRERVREPAPPVRGDPAERRERGGHGDSVVRNGVPSALTPSSPDATSTDRCARRFAAGVSVWYARCW